MIYQLDAVEYLFVFFELDMFRFIRPSSGAMDVTISLHMQHVVSCKQFFEIKLLTGHHMLHM